MRELKFRAKWGGRWFYFSLEDIAKAGKSRSSGMPGLLVHLNESEHSSQYTGLKDKNGVEIYEGDIVRWGHVEGFTECRPRKAVVKLEPALCFETFNLDENNHTFHFGSFAYAGCIDRAMEVLGNIHENPELLHVN